MTDQRDASPTAADSMTAIRISETGGPEVLTPTELPVQAPGAGELLVDVHAAGVNFIDIYHRSGLYPVELPLTIGLEGSGTVRAVGESTEGFAVGDRVCWATAGGSYASSVVVPAASALKLHESIPMDVAAALPLQGLTAHYLIDSVYPLAPGDRCLIHAAAGGTGRLLVQMAKLRGAEVLATAGGTEKLELARSAGADHLIDYSAADIAAAVEDAVGPNAINVVYDGVGAATFDAGIAVLKPRGTMASFGNASGPVPPIPPLVLSEKSLFLTRPRLFDYIAWPAELARRWEEIVGWVQAGRLEVRIGLKLPLAEAAEAHTALESRATTGKILLIP